MRKVGETMTKRSRFTYAETLERLKDSITNAGNVIFASIDQSAAAASVGLTLRPTTLLVFGNPKGGTPLMDSFPLVALDLPLRLLVWEEGGAVNLAYAPMSDIAARYGVTGMGERIEAMDRAIDALTDSVA
jgi:uncharacterized protein (DUF302 family)